MKHFDVEAYAKTTFNDFVLTPNKHTWQSISDKFDKRQHKVKQRIAYIRIAIFTAFFLYMPVSIINREDSLETGTGALNKIWIYEVKNDTQIANGNTTTVIYPSKADTKKKNKKGVKKAKPNKGAVQLVLTNTEKEKRLPTQIASKNEENHDESSFLEPVEVTDAEIDALMEKARQTIHMERAWSKARESLKNGILADVEREVETSNEGVYQDMKRSYIKLKTVISN
jgi:hypothetical protein